MRSQSINEWYDAFFQTKPVTETSSISYLNLFPINY